MNLIKEAYFRLYLNRPLPLDRASILMYHSVSPGTDYFMNVEPSHFEAQMAYLAARKTPVISLAELVRRLKTKEPLGGAVAITFDDGYRDNYTIAFPILKRYGFPATIFVTTDMIGKTDKRGLERLRQVDLRDIHANGLIAIAPHTKTHPKLANLAHGPAHDEIEGSQRAIERLTGACPTLFAYPYGNFNDETVRIAQECGFEAAVSVREGLVHPDADLMRLPRVSIDFSTSTAQFKGKLSTAIDYYHALKVWK